MSANTSHRMHAIQIVAALPQEPEDALLVLELAKQLVEGFLIEPYRSPPAPPLDRERGTVVSLSSVNKGASF